MSTTTNKSAAPKGRNIPARNGGRKFGTKSAFNDQGGNYARRFKDHETVIQFLTDPVDVNGEALWFTYMTHRHPVAWNLPCDGSVECPGCLSADPNISKTSRKIYVQLLANRKVEIYTLPVSLLKPLRRLYSRHGTLLGKVFTVFKYGEGLQTKYDIEVSTDLPPSKAPEGWKPASPDDYEVLVTSEFNSAMDKLGKNVSTDEDDEEVPF